MPLLDPGYLELLEQQFAELPNIKEYSRVDAMIRSFQKRFAPSRLRELRGEELLEELHGRESRDCLAYWLEFRDEDDFRAQLFGSIRGGSALKFGIYQRAEDGNWYTHGGEVGIQRELSLKEAVRIAEQQRDQLLSASEVVADLPDKVGAQAYGRLQERIERAAPDLYHLAFLHKFLFLQHPDKLDDYHSFDYQWHNLLQMGLRPPDPRPLYAAAGSFVEAWHQFRDRRPVHMSLFTHLLNTVNGAPCRFWRVGTRDSTNGESQWREMVDGSYVAIGWPKLGNLYQIVEGHTGTAAKEEIRAALTRRYPDSTPQQRGKDTSQIWRFFANMQEGDWVFAADGQKVLGIGRVLGHYSFASKKEFPHQRKVEWLTREPFPSPDKTGLQTTVYPLDGATDLLLEGIAHVRRAQRLNTRPAPHHRPAQLEGVLAAIHEELRRKGQVVLYGPPGTGKTWHAMRAARELAAQSSFGCGWTDLTEEQRAGLRGAGSPQQQRIWTCTFHPSYGYEEFVEGLRPRTGDDGGLGFVPRSGLFRRICVKASKTPDQDYFLLVDEFNRGDAARIFGELLTLLEFDKRGDVYVQLPFSRKRFSVPRNVFIIATMNTADRSIALLDSALRRRFGFIELLPDSTVLGEAKAGGVMLGLLLTTLNKRLVKELSHDGRNLQVGHSFFQRDGSPLSDFADLRRVLRHEIMPLLQEYCYDRPEALQAILGDKILDSSSGEIRNELFIAGREDDLRTALRLWEPTLIQGDAVDLNEPLPDEGIEE